MAQQGVGAVVIPALVSHHASNRVPTQVPNLASADGIGSSNVGVIIDKAENLTLHGAPDTDDNMVVVTKNTTVRNSQGQEIPIAKTECRNIGAWLARWLIEMSATLSVAFVATVAAILFPQEVFGSPFNVAFSLMGIVLITHVLFSYATGVYMNVYTSLWVTISHWVVRAMSYEPIYFLNDIVKLILIWSAQIAGAFAGVILGLLLFLDGTTLVATLSALSAPRYGVAPWVPGPTLVTNYQAGAFECIGSFMTTIAVLYCYGAKKLHKKVIWAGLIRGGSVFISTILMYSLTGASLNPMRWVVPLAYAGAGYGSVEQQLVYTLAPFIGGAMATAFFLIWVAVNKYCIGATSDDGKGTYTKLQENPPQARESNAYTGGLLKSNVANKVY